ERVIGLFRYIVLRGEGLQHLEGIQLAPYSAGANLPISTQQEGIYRVKVAAMPVPSQSMPPAILRTRCKPGTRAVVTEITLNSQAKLDTKFDDIPYRNLGEGFEREVVRVEVNPTMELSIEGHVDLEREKFCRYYAAPGNVDSSFERWAAERNFKPGRQIMKFQPALVVGYSKNQPQLQEDSQRPGHAEPSFFGKYNSGPSRTISEFQSVPYAMCFNDYPEFMSVEQVGRGTPLIEHFDAAAELAAEYVADQLSDGGRTAAWWEVKNESTIKSEWDYHYRKDVDSWAALAELHNKVADAIHEKTPQIKVGGPTSAWMQMQAANFGLYRNQQKFMDLTKDHVDFYSHHFYEDFASLGSWERRSTTYSNYLLGRLEATLDMFVAHMDATDNRKPILITECGSLQLGRAPSDYWLRLRSYSAYMHKMMQRPQQIDLAVPFAFLHMPWNPTSGDAAFVPKDLDRPGRTMDRFEQTPVAYLFDLWRDFDGRRLSVDHDADWLDVTAVHSEDRIQVAITNMYGRRRSIDLSTLTEQLSVGSMRQRRMFYRDGEVVYQDAVELEDLTGIPVDVEETTLVIIELNDPLSIQNTLVHRSAYAAKTAVATVETPVRFEVDVAATESVQTTRIVIGVSREGGLDGGVSGSINGTEFKADESWLQEFQHLFAPVEIEIPAGVLKASNTIEVQASPGTVITSVMIQTESL
ncbi:MAG: beta-agarase, partial [Planctomycetota bacterium]